MSLMSKVRDASGTVVARVTTARVGREYHMHITVETCHPRAAAMRLEPVPNVSVFVYYGVKSALQNHDWACRGLVPEGGSYGLAEHHSAGI